MLKENEDFNKKLNSDGLIKRFHAFNIDGLTKNISLVIVGRNDYYSYHLFIDSPASYANLFKIGKMLSSEDNNWIRSYLTFGRKSGLSKKVVSAQNLLVADVTMDNIYYYLSSSLNTLIEFGIISSYPTPDKLEECCAEIIEVTNNIPFKTI